MAYTTPGVAAPRFGLRLGPLAAAGMARLATALLALLALGPSAAVRAGITKTGTRPGSSTVEVAGVGSRLPFRPSAFSSWHYDDRNPLIKARPGGRCPDAQGNIYNANAVSNGLTDWNVFFGGWDGVDSCHDSVSVSVTSDTFASMNPHVPVIATGATHNLNNPSATKTFDGRWLMVYTQEEPQQDDPHGATRVNKPGISSSADGVTFNPSAGGTNFLHVAGYPYNWTRADVNGGNVILQVNDTLHLYFVDLKSKSHSVYLATAPMPSSPDEPPPTRFTYQGLALSEPGRIINDVARVNGQYLMGLHCNGPEVFYSVSKDPNTFPPAATLFAHHGEADQHIVSLGFVVDHTSTRVLGALYGAGAVPTLDHNRIFAAWLQRHVLFVGTDSKTVWGVEGSETAAGPDVCVFPTNGKSLEGRFMVYGTDYRNASARGTLLYTSEIVTVSPGDTWTLQDI